MRYGICTGIENAGLVKKLGYDYIELSVTKTMGLDPVAYAAGKKALEEAGLPTLLLDGDSCDRGFGGEGQAATRMEAFLEVLEGMA